MMGRKAVEPKLYLSFSLDAAVPANHLVRRLATAVNFDFVRGLVRWRYSHTGQPSVDPVVLFKLWLLGYLFNITSERRLCEEAGLNLAWRWFLGYELDEPIPDHSVLTKARRRFGVEVYERFFSRIVQLCEHAGLIQGDIVFVDSTLTKANASSQGLRSRALLQQRLRTPREFVDELEANADDDDDGDDAFSKPKSPRSGVNHIAVNPVDPDAQMFKKRGTTPLLSHKTHFVADGGKAGVITAVAVTGSCTSDGQAVGELLDRHERTLGRAARELVGDRGYGTTAAVAACSARGVVPTLARSPVTNTVNSNAFTRDAFTFIAERDVYICPAGQELRRFRFRPTPAGNIGYRPRLGVCHDCEVRDRCVTGKGDRTVVRHLGEELVEEMRSRMNSPRARRLMSRRRVLSERLNADAKEKHGMARAQFRGRLNMRIQALMTATVLNLKLLAKRGPEAQSGTAVLWWPRPAHDAGCLSPRRLRTAVAG